MGEEEKPLADYKKAYDKAKSYYDSTIEIGFRLGPVTSLTEVKKRCWDILVDEINGTYRGYYGSVGPK